MTQERGTPERMLESVKTNWFTYHHTQAGMEELYMVNDFSYFDFSSVRILKEKRSRTNQRNRPYRMAKL